MIKIVFINSKSNQFDLIKYTDNLIKEIQKEIQLNDLEFYFNKDRIRKSSFIINGKQFLVTFTYFITQDTTQLKVDIKCPSHDVFNNNELHDIKIKIKDVILEDWEQCVWLVDSQSERFAEDLYRDVHNVENSLRRLINSVLFYKLGGDWWEKYMPSELIATFNKREKKYRERATSFKDIHTNLLSIDTADLMKILEFRIYKISNSNIFQESDSSFFDLDDLNELFQTSTDLNEKEVTSVTTNLKDTVKHKNEFNYILSNLIYSETSFETHKKKLIGILKDQMTIEIDFWNDYFSSLFNVELNEFKGKWNNFSDDRNHVAHNKLIDNKLYVKFKLSMKSLTEMINKAEDKFNKELENDVTDFISELEYDAREYAIQQEMDLKDLIVDETGIEVLDSDQIIERIQEEISNSFEGIKDEYDHRSDLEIIYNEPDLESDELLFKITNIITEEFIKVDIEPFIDEDEESIITLNLSLNDEDEHYTIFFKNGMIEFNAEQGAYYPVHEPELDKRGLVELIDRIENILEDDFPEVEDSELATFECEYCYSHTVNFSSDIYEQGICISCGEKNNFGECLRCQELIDSPEDGLCDSCEAYIKEQ